MSDTAVIVAIVIPVLSMTTMGLVAIVVGCHFRFKARVSPEEADFETEGSPQPGKRKRRTAER